MDRPYSSGAYAVKKWFTEAIVLILSLFSQTALEGIEHLKSGGAIVQEIDRAYKRGDYDAFLKNLHTHYETAGKAGTLRAIFSNAKKAMHGPHSETLAKLKRHRQSLARVDKTRNQRLLEAVSGNPDLEIVQKVDTVVFTAMTDEQEAILMELEALKFEIPESAKAVIGGKISAIETEHYIKSLLIDIHDHMAPSELEDLERKKTVIQFAKLDRMGEAAKEYGDKPWMAKIEEAQVAFRVKRALERDYAGLCRLASGEVAPQNSVEVKVKAVMMDYLEERKRVLSGP